MVAFPDDGVLLIGGGDVSLGPLKEIVIDQKIVVKCDDDDFKIGKVLGKFLEGKEEGNGVSRRVSRMMSKVSRKFLSSIPKTLHPRLQSNQEDNRETLGSEEALLLSLIQGVHLRECSHA